MAASKLDADLLFEALASSHRRKIILSLALQPYSIAQLAVIGKLTLPAIHKHIKLLEAASLITRRKIGRVNFLALDRRGLKALQEWSSQFHTYWGSAKESLTNYEAFLDQKPTIKERK